MADTPGIPNPPGKTRLVQHFEKRYILAITFIQNNHIEFKLILNFKSEIEDHNEAWANLWDTNNDDMWDRGRPSPALIDLIEKDDVLNPITAEGQRRKVLVPVRYLRITIQRLPSNGSQGCGKGYDVVMLALHGFDVVGLEISSKGISIAEEYSRKEFLDPQTYNSGPSGSSNTGLVGRGSVTFIQGDFFKGDSLSDEKFDIIYDYTVSFMKTQLTNSFHRSCYGTEIDSYSSSALSIPECVLNGRRVWQIS